MAKTLISDPIWGPRNYFSWVLRQLVVRQYSKLTSYAISVKTNEPNLNDLILNLKKPNFGSGFGSFGPNLCPKKVFVNLTSTSS